MVLRWRRRAGAVFVSGIFSAASHARRQRVQQPADAVAPAGSAGSLFLERLRLSLMHPRGCGSVQGRGRPGLPQLQQHSSLFVSSLEGEATAVPTHDDCEAPRGGARTFGPFDWTLVGSSSFTTGPLYCRHENLRYRLDRSWHGSTIRRSGPLREGLGLASAGRDAQRGGRW